MEGVSSSVLLVPAQSKSRRLAAKACWAAWVRMADQRERREASTALRRIFLQSFSTMTTGGMLHAKLPRGSPRRDLMYSSAEPTLFCRVVSPRVLYRTVVSDSDGRK